MQYVILKNALNVCIQGVSKIRQLKTVSKSQSRLKTFLWFVVLFFFVPFKVPDIIQIEQEVGLDLVSNPNSSNRTVVERYDISECADAPFVV